MPEANEGHDPLEEESRPGLLDRFKLAILRSDADDERPAPAAPLTLEEAQAALPADDKERLVGLIAAPLAAMISILIIGSLLSHDPSPYFANGQPNKAHVDPSLYHELLYVLLGMSIIVLATAWYRKRLFLGITLALFGLAIFNLHFWGFGIPFLLFGAWLLVHAYRVQQNIKRAEAAEGGGSSAGQVGPAPKASPNKRYTQPARRPKKLPPQAGDA